MENKIVLLLRSRRFWAAIVGVIAIAAHDLVGLSEEQVQQVGLIITGWIVGDSISKTGADFRDLRR